MRKSMASLAVLLAALSTSPDKTQAQATDGNLTGVALDATGATIPNTAIDAENNATGVIYSAKTDTNGVYRINNIPAGTYAVTGSLQGFSKVRLERVVVELNHTTTANITLQVGGVTESVTVTEAATTVDTTTAQVQSTYNTRQAIDLPTTALALGPLNLSLLSAGVAGSGGYGLGEGPSVGGQRPRNNSFNIEGVDNNRKDVTGSNIRVSNEAVAEFTLMQNHFSAEFGHSGGGQFNTIVKSGTNDVHGTAFHYLQNRNLNAVDQAFKRQDIFENPRFDDNRFGGNVGGPFIRNKFFWYGLYEYNPIGSASSPSSATLAPTAEGYSRLNGIPGKSATNLGVLQQYLPAATAASDSLNIGGTEIPIGVIPITRPTYQNITNWIVSTDYNISSSDQLRVRYISNRSSGYDISTLPNLPGFLEGRENTGKFVMLTENHVFSPSLTNELRLGYNRYNDNIPSGDYQFPGLDMFPNITVNDLNVQLGPYVQSPQSGVINTYQVVNNMIWMKGSHAVKFGFDGRKYIAPTNFIQRIRGDYGYSNLERYLLDLPPDTIAQRNLGGSPYSGNSINLYGFINDDWRVRRNFSLNLGIRYEYKGVPRGDKLQSLNASSSRPGLIDFREPRAEKKNFAPRIGMAWSPGNDGRTSIRAGFGMAYDNYFDNLGTNSKPPQLEATIDDPIDGTTPGYLAGGGITPGRRPAELTPEDALAATSAYIPDQNLPYSIQWNLSIQRGFGKDYTAEVRYLGTRGVNLFTQHRLNVMAPVTASRSLPVYLQRPSQGELDSLSLTLSDLQAIGQWKPEWAAAGFDQQNVVAFDNRGNSIYHGLAAELTRRFSRGLLFKGAYTWSKLIDDSTADLYSTELAPRRPQDFGDMRSERAKSFLDRTHRLTWSWVWETPFFNGNENWFLRNMIGNWVVGGIYTFESPQYATVQSNADSNLNGDTAGDRAVINPNGQGLSHTDTTPLLNSQAQTVGYLANDPTAHYIRARPGVYPNAGRNTIPMGRINNWDLNITKRFSITERVRFEIRGLFLNAFNQAQYTPGYTNTVLFKDSSQTRNHLIPGNALFGDYTQVFDSNSRKIQIVARLTF